MNTKSMSRLAGASAFAIVLAVSGIALAQSTMGPGMMGGSGAPAQPTPNHNRMPDRDDDVGRMGPQMMGGGYGWMGPQMMGWGPGGMGPQMMGWGPEGMGPQMMGWGGGTMGPWMMGAGSGYGACAGRIGRGQSADAALTIDEVTSEMQTWLTARGNPHVKLGAVAEKNADTITADVVTTDNGGLVQRMEFNRHSGRFWPAPN